MKAKKKAAAKKPAKYLARESDLAPLMVRVPRKKRAEFQEKCESLGVSVNSRVNLLIEKDLNAA